MFEANESSSSLDIFAVPVDDAEIQTSIQKAGDTIEEVERIVRNSTKGSALTDVENMSRDDISEDNIKVTENADGSKQKGTSYVSNMPTRIINTSSKDNMFDTDNATIVGARELLSESFNEDLIPDGEKGSAMKSFDIIINSTNIIRIRVGAAKSASAP